MHYDLIIKNGNLVTPQESKKTDIAINNGKIIDLGRFEKECADETFNAQGLFVLPGIIDAHVHFRDPGLTEKEDFETGSISAAMGGVTFIADMPNVNPVTSTVERFREKTLIASQKSYLDFGLYSLLTNENISINNNKSVNSCNTLSMQELKNAGTFGFKVFLGTSTGDIACPEPGVLYEQMLKSAELGVRTGFHAESSELNAYFTNLCKNKKGAQDGLLLSLARPVISEVMAIKTAVCYAKYTGAKIHIHHVTSADGVQVIREAKNEGINITCETCPHYLVFNCETDKAQKVYPPIRREIDRLALWEGLKTGIIDMIASDHAPHTLAEKNLPLFENETYSGKIAPAGLSGVETLAPIMLNEVNKGAITINDFVRLLCEQPAKIWGIYPQKGSLLPGTDADITILDMAEKKLIRAENLHSKCKHCAYEGMWTQGMPTAAIVRGKFVMKDSLLTGEKGYGKPISPGLLKM